MDWGSMRDWSVRNESRPMIGVVMAMVVVVSATSVSRNTVVAESDMGVWVFSGE